MIYITKSAEETEALGARLAATLNAGEVSRAFIALYGEMGSGKTAFTRGFAKALGISSIKSPTYTIVNEHKGTRNLYHFDMYRIESEDDLYSIGYEDYLEKSGYIVCEWCENIAKFVPESAVFVKISRIEGEENSRSIDIHTGEIYDNIGF